MKNSSGNYGPPRGKGHAGPVGAPRRSSPSPPTAGGPCKDDASGSRERWVSAPAGRSLMAALQEWSSWRYKDSFFRLILKRGSHKLLQKVQVGRNPAFGWVLEVLLGQAGHIRCDCGESRRSPHTRFPCSPAAPAMQNVVLPPSHVRPLRLSQSHFLTGKNLGVGCHFHLQGIFSTEGSNRHLLYRLRCRRILNSLSHPETVYKVGMKNHYAM
ncbi:uncharacterized protein [Odocoileus virginianus]|uniref:Uncharacterized protein n=1 Tax=Odocoileus virginianus TaxID=9874 RepID=A0ABM4ISG7_ODOVR